MKAKPRILSVAAIAVAMVFFLTTGAALADNPCCPGGKKVVCKDDGTGGCTPGTGTCGSKSSAGTKTSCTANSTGQKVNDGAACCPEQGKCCPADAGKCCGEEASKCCPEEGGKCCPTGSPGNGKTKAPATPQKKSEGTAT